MSNHSMLDTTPSSKLYAGHLAGDDGEPYIAPPSFNQEQALRLFDLDNISGYGYTPFHIVDPMLWRGKLDVKLLERSLNDLVTRHEALRTSFQPIAPYEPDVRRKQLREGLWQLRSDDYLHVQKVSNTKVIDVTYRELRCSASDLNSTIQRTLEREYATPFDLERAPLMRATVLSTGSAEYLIILVLHHLISDMASQHILRTELQHLYSAHAAGRQSRLPPLNAHYTTFSSWQRTWSHTPDFSAILGRLTERWLASRSGLLAYSSLPVSIPAITLRYAPAFEFVTFEPSDAEQIRAFARTKLLTISTLFLTSLAVMLSRVTGRRRFITRLSLQNRTRSEFHNVVGWFVSGGIVSFELSDRVSVDQLLRQVQEDVALAIRYQEVPMYLAWKALGEPVFDDLPVSFDFVYAAHQRIPQTQVAEHITVERLPFRVRRQLTRPVGLDFVACEEGSGILLCCGYRQDRIPLLGIKNMLSLFHRILLRLVKSCDTVGRTDSLQR